MMVFLSCKTRERVLNTIPAGCLLLWGLLFFSFPVIKPGFRVQKKWLEGLKKRIIKGLLHSWKFFGEKFQLCSSLLLCSLVRHGSTQHLTDSFSARLKSSSHGFFSGKAEIIISQILLQPDLNHHLIDSGAVFSRYTESRYAESRYAKSSYMKSRYRNDEIRKKPFFGKLRRTGHVFYLPCREAGVIKWIQTPGAHLFHSGAVLILYICQ